MSLSPNGEPEPIRVIIVDDQELFRRGLTMLMDAEPGLDVVGEDGQESPVVIRTKDHRAAPMSLDQAMYEMELVGHDFFLFVDATTSQPSVVYRRRGYDYGVIRLAV